MKKALSFLSLFLTICIFAEEPFTFYVAADPHVGYFQAIDNEAANRATIDDMNALVGTPAPWNDKEEISKPRGLLIAGDLTNSGKSTEWIGTFSKYGFYSLFAAKGDGLLTIPVYEGYGNHDIEGGYPGVLLAIYFRNRCRQTPIHKSSNGLHYSWDWNGVHFVNLNLYPGRSGPAHNSLTFLKEDLKNNLHHPKQPIILYHHYDYQDSEAWWTQREREEAYKAMKEYNIIAIFVGHNHLSYQQEWNGIDVYALPSTYEGRYSLCHIKENTLFICHREKGEWLDMWQKEFFRPT